MSYVNVEKRGRYTLDGPRFSSTSSCARVGHKVLYNPFRSFAPPLRATPPRAPRWRCPS